MFPEFKEYMGRLIVLSLLFFAFGFSWKKCLYKPSLGGFGVIAPTTMSGQFTSSTGRCSAIGLNTEE